MKVNWKYERGSNPVRKQNMLKSVIQEIISQGLDSQRFEYCLFEVALR